MPHRSLMHVHSVLLQMIRQDYVSEGANTESEKTHVWEVRHAGLLGIKYEVAVRSDMFEVQDVVKKEEADAEDEGRGILRGVVQAAILGCVEAYYSFRCVS